MITISVPSKVHLLGEHAVVYGKPAILSAINKRIFISISFSKRKEVVCDQKYHRQIRKLLEILEEEIKNRTKLKKIRTYSLKVDSEFPAGSGLGSSASLSAGITAAMLTLLKISWDKRSIFDIGYVGEKFFHGNPSGGDLAAVIEGGLLWYRKELEFLKTFNRLPFKPHKNIGQFVLINSGKPKEPTKVMVEQVARFKKSNPQKIKELFDSQEELAKQMVIAIKEGWENKLIECMSLGERNLEKLGVVGVRARYLIRSIEKLGGSAKINGGGGVLRGSGMLLVYHKNIQRILNYAKENRLEILRIQIGAEGLRRDE
jgi:mevalonate kinase